MKPLHLILLAATLALLPGASAAEHPKADPNAVVVCGNARFTVLTPRLIRMEWSQDGRFEDRATLTFVNRETKVPDFNVRESKKRLTLITSALRLTYLKDDGPFTADNLEVAFRIGKKEVAWHPGMEDSLNLMGTARTLDGADGDRLKEPLEQGILSRSGWAVVDDSQRHVLTPDSSAWGRWVARGRAAGPLHLRLRPRLSSGAGRLCARRRPCADAPQVYVRVLVEPLLAVLRQRVRRPGAEAPQSGHPD